MRLSFTELRKEILRCIEGSERPLMAKDVFDRLETKPNLSTVYRALDFLCKNGLIKSVSFNSDASYFFSGKKAHAHFLYCQECSAIQVFDKCFAERIQDDVEHEFDYKIMDHFFYFSGLCDSCQRHKKNLITA
jgi:Fur family ferric uptake transcriptional regulator